MKQLLLLFLTSAIIGYSQDWTPQVSGTTQNLMGVTMIDANNALVFGESGTILRTTDGGANWNSVASPTTKNLFGASFCDANNGLAVGNQGVLLKTTDGGVSWSQIFPVFPAFLYGVHFVNSTTAYVVGDPNYIAKSTDGGLTWVQQVSPAWAWAPLIGVKFSDPNNGFVVGYEGIILKTTNGGIDWTVKPSGTWWDLYRIANPEPGYYYVVGYEGTVLQSTDSGETWYFQTIPTSQMLRDIVFVSPDEAWVCGNNGRIFHTTDKGVNWEPVFTFVTDPLFGIAFSPDGHGLTAGLNGRILSYWSIPAVPVAGAASSITTTSFNANWSAAGGAQGYKLDVSTDPLFSSFLPGYQNLSVGPVTTYQVTGLSAGTEYYYRVRAYSANGTSGNSGTISVTTLPPPPNTTAGTGITRYAFNANWESVTGATGYYLDIAYNNTFALFVSGYQNLDVGNVTTYNISGLVPGYTYYYRLRAYNPSGTSDNSNIISVALLPPQADLQLIAAVDKTNPVNLEVLTYTFTITNLGPDTAKNVVLQASIPRGFVYASSNAVNSTYNPATGEWTLPPTFGPAETAVLTIVDSVDYFDQAYDFRDFYEFNIYAKNDATLTGVFNGGKIAAGDDLYIEGSNFGGQLRTRPVTPDVVIAGDNLTFLSGTVHYGNVVYGNTTNLPNGSVVYPNGVLIHGSPLNFASLNSYLNSLSAGIRNYDINGTASFAGSTLNLAGTDIHLNVFNVSEAQFEGASTVNIDIPKGSVALINVGGTTIDFNGEIVLAGNNLGNYILFNFGYATSINLSGSNFFGTIIAPFADITNTGSLVRGQMFGNNVITIGSHQNHSFLGFIPLNRTIGFLPEVSSSFSVDPDQTNNDDPAVVVINTTAPYGTAGNGVWTVASVLPVNEMVISMARKDANTILAGTNLGHIIEMDNNGVLGDTINSTMTPVAYIHDLKVSATGDILAATETGIFRSTDNGATWISHLSGKEIRAILFGSDGYWYAGSWAFGVYRSTDQGYTWVQKNDNLASTVITSMMHRVVGGPQYTVFAGTIGAGVAATIDYANTWMNLSLPYEFVTCMDKTSEGIIFAGTLADGVYRSYDNGNTWTKMAGLPDGPIYAIRIDGDNNIFVSSWMFGIYGSADLGDSWAYLGLGGYGISASFPGPDGKLFASSAGKLFVNNSPLTSVRKKSSVIPNEYALEQNFPNPFNPSTKIKYSLAGAGFITLEVFDILGRSVATLVSEEQSPGIYEVEFNTSVLNVASGVYYYQLRTRAQSGENEFVSTKKMLLIK